VDVAPDIAALRPGDRAAAVALWESSGLTRPWNDPYLDFDRALAGPSSTVLGTFADGDLAGTAMVGHDGHRGWVYYLAVTERLRGRGLGRALMTACEAWVAERGIPKLQLMVRSGNAGVVAFYERLGYIDGEVVVLGRFL
jgi:ribosomal protein S18 acetylase RimI-like enzyme